MTIFEFQSVDGPPFKVIEKAFPMSRAPLSIRVKGKRYKRIISRSTQVISEFKPYASISAPKRVPGFPHDKRGRNIIQTRADEHRLAKLTGMAME